MLDAIYYRYSRHHEKPLDPHYKPKDAIQSRKLLNENADRLVVIFPGWHTHNFPINVLAKRLVRKGWAVLFYDFHDQIIEPDEDVVVESFRYIRDTVCAEIGKLIKEKDYKELHFIGISLGGVPMALVCDKFPHFTSATTVVGGDSLAIDMWYGLRTEHYRHAFEKMHVSIRKLASEWSTVAPQNHLRHFKGKQVKFFLSTHDKFVMTKYQKRLAKCLAEAGAEVKIKRRYTGHMLTILRFCYFDNPF